MNPAVSTMLNNPVAQGGASYGAAFAVTTIIVYAFSIWNITIPANVSDAFMILLGSAVHLKIVSKWITDNTPEAVNVVTETKTVAVTQTADSSQPIPALVAPGA